MPTGKLVAIVVAVIFGIGLLAMAGLLLLGYAFVSRVSVTTVRDAQGRERTVKVETPLGRVRVDKDTLVDPKSIDIPLYPGAAVVNSGGSATVDVDLDFADTSLRLLAVEMETSDPIDKVIEFYRQNAADFVFSRKPDGKVEFRWEEGKLKKIVGIREKRGKRRIALANIGEPEAN